MFDKLRLALIRRMETLTGQTAQDFSPEPPSDSAASLRAQGNALLAQGNLADAEKCFRAALSHDDRDTKSLVCLGYVLKEQNRLSEARIALKRAIDSAEHAPDEFEMHYLLGQISEQQGDLKDAEKNLRESLRLNPGFSRACSDLCRVLDKQGQQPAIRKLLEDQVAANPQNADYHLWLAEAAEQELDFQVVADNLRAAVDLGVKSSSVYERLGAALFRLGHEAEGVRVFRDAQAMDPALAADALFHRGYYHVRSGNLQDAISYLDQSVVLRPSFLEAHSLLLMTLSHAGGNDKISYANAAKRYAQAVKPSAQPARSAEPLAPAKAHGAPLRIGFVSADFRKHPVSHFLSGVLKNIDRQQFELLAYSSNPYDDSVTESLKPLFNEWHAIRGLSDEAAAELIRSHHVDILIDLSGHTGENRLAVFARRPAPVQATWLGYFASTGLEEMDYIIADPACVPDDSPEWFSEKVIRVPDTRLCMTPPETSREIAVGPPPSVANGFCTFGTFQQSTKITAKVIATWARVLKALPTSRLRIQSDGLKTSAVRERICNDLTAAGIELSRVDLLNYDDFEAYLQAHNEVDVLLDTFPYPGGTTTAFALWMGVPTVTLAGNSMLSRQGTSMLGCVGLSDLSAVNEDAYVETAVRLAQDTARLAELRKRLRADALKSLLFDSPAFASNFQKALLQMQLEAEQR